MCAGWLCESSTMNVLDVLMYLFQNYMKENCDLESDQDLLMDELKQAGFGLEEISCAFNWLEGLADISANLNGVAVNLSTFRVLAAEEQVKIDPDCWAYLLFLESLNILDAANREIVIDRLMGLEAESINVNKVKWVTLMVLFNQPNTDTALRAMETLVLSEAPGVIH